MRSVLATFAGLAFAAAPLLGCPPAHDSVVATPTPTHATPPAAAPTADSSAASAASAAPLPSPSAAPPPPTASAPVIEPDDPAFAAIRDTKTRESFPGRAKLARLGRLRLEAEGPPVADGAGKAGVPGDQLVVVADGGAVVRVVVRRGGLGLLAWVERADLAPSLARAALVRPQPLAGAAEPDAPGVWLAPGADLEVLEQKPGFARVRFEGDEGWIDAAALAPVVEAKPFHVGSTHELPAGAAIFRGRGTGALMRSDDSVWVEALGEPDRSYTKVAYVKPCEPWRRVVGFVPSFLLTPTGGVGFGCGRGGVGHAVLGGLVVVRTGQVLRASAAGPRVAVALSNLTGLDEGPVAGGRSVLLDTPWGVARFLAEPVVAEAVEVAP